MVKLHRVRWACLRGKMKRILISMMVVLLMAGCATKSGFEKARLRKQLGDQPVQTETDIAKILSLNPQLPDPFRLGVFFDDATRGSRYSSGRWRWTPEDQKKLFALAEGLKKSGVISEVVPITTVPGYKRDIKTLRIAAARYGVDAVLIVSGVSDVDRYTNSLGWTYILIVTLVFVPASEADALFIARASMWDLRNGFLYFSAESEAEKSQTRPNSFINVRELVRHTKEEALQKLLEKIKRTTDAWMAEKAQ